MRNIFELNNTQNNPLKRQTKQFESSIYLHTALTRTRIPTRPNAPHADRRLTHYQHPVNLVPRRIIVTERAEYLPSVFRYFVAFKSLKYTLIIQTLNSKALCGC